MVDPDRLSAAYETARCDLLAESVAAGHWIGQLSSSAFSTAAAISALAIVERSAPTLAGNLVDAQRQCATSELIMASVRWLARHQHVDGGWGDTDHSPSNLATTMMVRYAFALTAVPADHPDLLEIADAYIKSRGGVRGFKRLWNKDKLLTVPVLANGALAGVVPWRRVPSLPFELALLSQRFWNLLRLPSVSHVLAPLIAIGQSRYFHRRPWNPVTRVLRWLAAAKTFEMLEPLVPADGGFLESVPLTSLVVMNLASMGHANHAAVRQGVEFLLATVRPDGSWPITSNRAVSNTAQAVNALAAAGEDVRELTCLDWLLASRHCTRRPDSDVTSGGWSWTDRPGGVPDVDDTAGALLALAAWQKADAAIADKIQPAAIAAIRWLLDVQNADGGWPALARGQGKLAFDRSGCDLTAHALRALAKWRNSLGGMGGPMNEQVTQAIERGQNFLAARQHPDGYWLPLWFGNEHRAGNANPVYGTAKVLAAYRDLNRLENPAARRALDWLAAAAHEDGSWGTDDEPDLQSNVRPVHIEETALAVEALLTCGAATASAVGPVQQAAAQRGLEWLIDAVEANRHQESSPIGCYFDKLWYCEKLSPLIATTAALGQAAGRVLPHSEPSAVAHTAKA